MKTLRKSLLALALTAMMTPLAMANPVTKPAPQLMNEGFDSGKGGKPVPAPTPKPPGPPKSEGE